MALTDIISEEEIRAPNMEVAQGGPEDFMTEDEMDPEQDPELQQLLESLPGEQAQVLMQLIKEFKAMVAQGFQGEFEDFVKMKMSTAQGGPEEFMTEDEMQIGPEEQQSMIPMSQQVAQGGRIGYDNGGPTMGNPPVFEEIEDMREWRIANPDVEDIADYKGYYDRLKNPEDYDKDGFKKKRNKKYQGGIMDVAVEEQVPLPDIDTPQQRIMDWLEAHNLPPTPENIQKAIVAMAREGQGPVKGTRFGSHMDIPQMQMPGPPTGEGYVPEELIGQDQSPQGIASMVIEEPEIIPQEKPYTEDMFSDSVDVLLKGIKGAPDSTEYLQTVLEEKKHEFKQNNPDVSDERIDEIIIEKQFNIDNSLRDQRIKNIPPPFNLAQGGRIGYAYGDQVTADSPGIMSQVPDAQAQQIEQSQLYEEAMQKIMNKFYEKFPGADTTEMRIEDMVAELQAEGVSEHATDILSFAAGMDMITPEGVRSSTPVVMRGMGDQDYLEHQFDHPVDEMRGRPGYGLGSLVKSVFKGAKSAVKGVTKSIKKFAKSDIGKMALMYMATAGLANVGAGAMGQPWLKGGAQWLRPSNVMGLGKTGWGNIGKSFTNLGFGDPATKLTSGSKFAADEAALQALVDDKAATSLGDKAVNTFLSRTGDASTKGGLFSKALGSFKKNPMPWILGTSGAAGLYTAANPGKDNLDNLMGNYKGEVSDWDKIFADIRSGKKSTAFSTENTDYPYPNYMNLAAEGGRMGRAEGGLMNLGGLEKDYRAEGGFVPIGKKEKADDVPARLSVNEFVFTADAVRNAGGGDVDRGAEVMENVMTNLEQGGSISEESQGLEGAREMFEVSERLSEVV